MEKRLFYTLFITLLFLISYNYFVSKYYPQYQFTHQEDSPSLKKEEKEKTEEVIKEFKPENLVKIDTANFIITFSSRGGYIKTIYLKAYQEELSFKNIGFIPQDKDKEFTSKVEGEKVIFTTPEGEKKEFIFDQYTLTIKLTSFFPELLIFSNRLISNTLEQRYQEFFYLQDNNLQRKNFKNITERVFNDIEFAGTRDKYYCLSLLKGSYNIKWVKNEKEVDLYLLSSPQEITLYIGPQTEKKLKLFNLQGIMYYGFFHGIGVGIIKLLYFFYFLTKNWGVSIIFLAIFIYFVLFPFTIRSTKQMKRMQEIQGIIQLKLKELKEKYKDNYQKVQKETLELYKKYKINPLGGCLPLFFQFPIFIALYQVLERFIELKGTKFLWIKDLSLPDRAFKLPLNLPILGNYINLLPIFILILSLIQQKFTSFSSPSSDQRSIGLFFAVVIGIIFYNFPSCVVLYWFIQNLFTFIYQVYVAQVKSFQN